MAFNQAVTKAVENIIHGYIQHIASKYDLDPSALLVDWEGAQSAAPSPPPEELSEERLLKCKKAELQALCKQRRLKSTGTKGELCKLLLGGGSITTPKAKTSVKSTTKGGAKSSKTPPVLNKLMAKRPTLVVRPNKHGNIEHQETGLVFEKKTKKVIGRQQDDGSVAEITQEDINICNKFNFAYTIPSNLDSNTGLEDVQVEELDEDEELEEEEEEEILMVEELVEEDSEFEDEYDEADYHSE